MRRRAASLLPGLLAWSLLCQQLIGMPARAMEREVPEPRPTADRSFFESYTVLADLDGGVYLQLQLVVTNAGLRKRAGGCRLLITEEGRPTLRRKLSVPERDWHYTRGPDSSLSIGKCELTGGDETTVRARFEDLRVDLTLAAAIEPVKPVAGRVRVGKHFYESDILIPWASARARIRSGEGAERVLHGRGYSDHARSTTLPPELAERWVRFRGLAERGSVLLLARFPSNGGDVEGWLWVEGERAPVRLSRVRVSRLASRDGQWQIHLESVSGRVYDLETRRELVRRAPIEERGFLGRILRPLFGNPVTYTYRAELRQAETEPASAPLRGIAELTLVNE